MVKTTEMHQIEREIYEEYQTKIIPFIVTLEALDGEFPVEILNEIRAIFTHFLVYKLENSDNDLHLALRHLRRAILDCHKYVCVSIEENIKMFRHEYRNVNLSLADNGKFLPTLNKLHQVARGKVIEAKRFESGQKNTSNDKEEETDLLYQKYEEAWTAYDDLDKFLEESNQAIGFASNQSKKASIFNKVSLAIGMIGILVGVIGILL